MVTEVLLAVIFMFLFFAQCVLKITLKYFDDNIYFRLFFFFENQTLILPHSKRE